MQTDDEVFERLLVAPSQPACPDAPAGELVMGGIYLVEDRIRAEFQERVPELQRELGRLGIELRLSGPRPAYNFVPGAIGAAW